MTNQVIGKYQRMYTDKFGIKPVVNGKISGSIIKKLLKEHSPKGLERIVELYFEDPSNSNSGYHLPNILCAYSLNKYLPNIKLNPMIYDNAKEENEEIW
jgi:hypothetical protein